MRYVIGCRVPNKLGQIEEGVYAFGKYGFAGMFGPEYAGKDTSAFWIPVFDNLESAQKYVKNLSHSYRKEFHTRVNRLCKIEDFRFYLLKFDTPKMGWIKLHREETFPRIYPDYPGRKDYRFDVVSSE